MPQLQWLGVMPRDDRMSKVAEALGKGISGYVGTKARLKERAEDRELKLKEIGYDKKVKTANMIIDAKKYMNDEQASKMDSQPQIRELFEDLEWPYPEGSLSTSSSIKIEAIKAVGQGIPLQGMSMDETKKAAGILVADKKITASDVTQFEKDIPAWEKLMPGKQKKQKEAIAFRQRFKSQFGSGIGMSGATGDPLNVRK